jgi:hypothetical protein
MCCIVKLIDIDVAGTSLWVTRGDRATVNASATNARRS